MAVRVVVVETSRGVANCRREAISENAISGVGLASSVAAVCRKDDRTIFAPGQTKAGSSEAVARLLAAIGGRRAAS